MSKRTGIKAALFAGLLVLGSLPASAQDKNEIVPAPACINNKGETVIFTDRTNDRRPDLAAGMAWRNPLGKPEVIRSNFAAASAEFQLFIALHECAHHQTGDVDLPHPPRNAPQHLYNEALADCIAVMRLRDDDAYSYDKDRLQKLTDVLREDMLKIGFPEISIASRVNNMTHCYTLTGNAQEMIDYRLQERGLKQ